MAKRYRFNWDEMKEFDCDQILAKIDAIADLMNTTNHPSIRDVLGMLKIEEVSLLTDNTGGYAE